MKKLPIKMVTDIWKWKERLQRGIKDDRHFNNLDFGNLVGFEFFHLNGQNRYTVQIKIKCITIPLLAYSM